MVSEKPFLGVFIDYRCIGKFFEKNVLIGCAVIFYVLKSGPNNILILELIPSKRNPPGTQIVTKYPNSDTFFGLTKSSLS